MKCFKLLAVVAVCVLGWPTSSEAGILFHRHGCAGGQAQASAGCQGKQAAAGCVGKSGGCTSAQAGCVGHSGGCHGGFGGRFHPLERFRNRHQHASYSQPSATIEPPLAKPMPKNSTALALAAQVFRTSMTSAVEATDALGEVNAARAKRGLRPFQRDEGLTIGAQKCAEYRAAKRMAGHTRNDFQFLPAGSTASAGGCAALEPSWGWGSCCTYEQWTHAGAAIVVGDDNRRYMQLFVR